MDSPRGRDSDRDYRRRSRSPERAPAYVIGWRRPEDLKAHAFPLFQSAPEESNGGGGGRGGGGGGANPGNNLFVSGVSNRVRDDDLETLFSRHGPLEKVRPASLACACLGLLLIIHYYV